MFDQWQQPLDIPLLIRQGATLQGEARISELSQTAGQAGGRLHGVVLNDAPVHYVLNFARDAQGRAVIHGVVETAVELTCQRCLQPVSVPIHAELALGVVQDEAAAKKLPDSLEPLLLGDDPIRLADLIEDEILLALPVVPRHEHVCVPAHREHEGAEGADNPFAALRGLVKPPTH